ncbi:MAG TPA: NAD-dependent epimerase/dehydratase family protein [Polyangia bacterium]
MKTLVTGATGFLGAHLVAELCRQMPASNVRVFSQSRSASLAALGVDVCVGSVTDPAALERAVAGVDKIYHLAGMVSRKPEDGHRMYEVHVEGTRLLCAAAIRAGAKRMVLASTSGTIAVSDRDDAGLDESCDPPLALIGKWPYYASKYYQEETARRACDDKLELVIVNPSLLLGPGDDRLSSTRDIVSFIAGEIPMVPRGGLNFVDVRDVATILPVAMEKGRAGERYLLGGHNMSFADFFGRLERLTKVSGPKLPSPKGKLAVIGAELYGSLFRAIGRTPTLDPAAVDMANHHWYFTHDKAVAELGYTTREATDTLLDTVVYIRKHILGRKPLVGGGAKPSVAQLPG